MALLHGPKKRASALFYLAPQVGFEPTTLRLTEGLLGYFAVATGCYKTLYISQLQVFLLV